MLLNRLLYRDALMLVIDKPAGIPVHKGSGGGENLEQHFDALRFGLPRLPALAHRLDRDTSGCLVLGRNRHGLATLGKLFEQNKITKTYWAVVKGTPKEPEGIVDAPLAKVSERKDRWQMKADPSGLPSLTEYMVRGTSGEYSWIEFKPKTGRTHQLRVHACVLGCPIIGDKIYGEAGEHGLQLHAHAIQIPLYAKKEPIAVTAPVPAHMLPLLEECGLKI